MSDGIASHFRMTISCKNPQSLKSALRDLAYALGFHLFGIAAAKPLQGDLDRLRDWIQRGNHASMGFLAEKVENRTDPKRMLRGAKSVIMCGVSYAQPALDLSMHTGRAEGQVARFALGQDYHLLIRRRLDRLAAALRDGARGAIQTQCHVDSGSILERAFAREAGLGFIGKNNCLIHPQFGSWILVGCILTNCSLPPDQPMPAACGECRRCLDACPTRALSEPFQLDARKCLSYLTIENRQFLDSDVAAGFKGRLFGCDCCQESCPFNLPKSATADPCLLPESRTACANPLSTSLAAILSIQSNREFERAFAESSLLRARRKGLQRNALLAAAHLGRRDLIPIIRSMANDPRQSSDIRKTAQSALERFEG